MADDNQEDLSAFRMTVDADKNAEDLGAIIEARESAQTAADLIAEKPAP